MSILDPTELIKSFGYVGVGGIIFAESGIIAGFFLPGDSLLFTAGLLASQGYLNIALLIVVAFVAAVLGDSTGYGIGRWLGPSLFQRKDSRLFSHKRITEAHTFFDQHGGMAVILARFTPIIRTFIPVIAGVGAMRYRTFVIYNVIGGLLWTVALPLLGYALGNTVPNIDKYLLPIIAVIITVSLAPAVIHALKQRRKAKSGDDE